MSAINWPATLDESTRYLRDLLRMDTTNPPGNERLAADYIAGILHENDLEATILDSAPNRANLVARLPGDGSLPPLLLMGHVDVVTAEPDKWTHPPFSAHVDQAGYIYGRGAVDMKQTVAAQLTALLSLKRAYHDQGNRPKRDIIYMALADEETGGEFGAEWMAKHHADLFADAEYALNEGGGDGVQINGVQYVTIQAGEKGTSRFYLHARGTPGHGSVPQPNASLIRLAAAVHRLGTTYLPPHLTRTTRGYLEILARTQPEPAATAFRDLLDTLDMDRILPELPVEEHVRRELNAMLRNTAMPTILKAGRQLNVIPDFAEAGIDGRILPGQSREAFVAELRAAMGPETDGLEIEWTPHFGIALENEPSGPLTDVITEVLAERAPGAHLLPTLLTGGTDAKAFVPLGIRVFGFSPLPPTDTDVFSRAHAHDERLHIDSYHYCVRTTYDIVERFVTRAV
jgi:acetylornithine deacetylase/succinyl-diaminopimelate desuccinylase-like protein